MKGQEEYDLMEDKDSMMKLLEMGFTDLTRNQEALNLNQGIIDDNLLTILYNPKKTSLMSNLLSKMPQAILDKMPLFNKPEDLLKDCIEEFDIDTV